MIITTLIGIMSVIANAILSGVGNSIASESEEKNHADFRKFNFIYMWISGWSAITLFVLYQNFMKLWVGDKYLLPTFGALLFSIYYYFLKNGDMRAIYSSAAGLWWQNRKRAIYEMIANVALNYILGEFLGVYGIIGATIIPLVTINFTVGAHILYKEYFRNESEVDYFKDNGFYFIVTVIGGMAAYGVSTVTAPDYNWVNLMIRFLICLIIPNVIYFLFYFKTENYMIAEKWIKEKFLVRMKKHG